MGLFVKTNLCIRPFNCWDRQLSIHKIKIYLISYKNAFCVLLSFQGKTSLHENASMFFAFLELTRTVSTKHANWCDNRALSWHELRLRMNGNDLWRRAPRPLNTRVLFLPFRSCGWSVNGVLCSPLPPASCGRPTHLLIKSSANQKTSCLGPTGGPRVYVCYSAMLYGPCIFLWFEGQIYSLEKIGWWIMNSRTWSQI